MRQYHPHTEHLTKKTFKKSGGYVFMLAIIVSFALTAIGISLATVAAAKYSKTKRDIYVVAANYAAEAGVSDSISQLNDNVGFGGFFPDDPTNTKEFYNNANGRAVYNTKVTGISGSSAKTIVSTGKIYIPASSTTPLNTKTIEVTVTPNSEATSYPVIAGNGGLIIESGSSLAASKIFSAGKVAMLSGAGTIGSLAQPTQLSVANAACTNASSYYPAMCPSSDPPISIDGGAGGIFGSVCATNQPATAGITTSQLDASCTPVRNIVNTSSRPALSSGLNSTPAVSCTSSGPQSIPANIRVTGNVTISGGCSATLNGTVYIEGNLTISGASTRIRVADSFSNIPAVVMATGTITIDGATVERNTSGASARFISFLSSDNGCTYASPTCCTKNSTCTELPNSADRQASASIDAVICRNGCKANYAQLVAYFGRIVLHGSNVNQSYIGSVAGQSVLVQSNSGTVNVINPDGNTLSDAIISRWAIVDYKQVYN